MRDALIDGQRLHPEANGHAKRLLTDLQALAFVPEWAEQTTNVEEDLRRCIPIGQQTKRVVYWTAFETVSGRLFARRRWPLVESSLVTMKGTTIWKGENENHTCTLLDEDGWECGLRWPTARALAAHQRHTQVGYTR